MLSALICRGLATTSPYLTSRYVRPEAGEPLASSVSRLGLKQVLFAFTDLFGVLRAKLVPAYVVPTQPRLQAMERDGAGFAGFAAWLDLSPATGDVLAHPDPSSLVQLPWRMDTGMVQCNLSVDGRRLTQAPRNILHDVAVDLERQHGLTCKTGVELEFHLLAHHHACS